ncbi:MAG: secretin N-terminal domain-containing protein [Planctomycetota bacterium]
MRMNGLKTARFVRGRGQIVTLCVCALCLLPEAGAAIGQTEPAPTPATKQPPEGQPAQRRVPATQPSRPATQRPAAQGQRPAQPGQPGQAQQRQPDEISEMIRKLPPETVRQLAGADVIVEVVGDQVILQGPEEAVKLIELLIRGLDQDMERKQKAVEVVVVSERDANEIARSVEQSLRDALKQPNQTADEQVKLTPLASNILLVSALPEHMDFVLDVISRVDAIPDPLGKVELMRFDVMHRKASDVSKELEKIITQLRVAAGQKKDQGKLQIIPNNSNNTITVTARETEREKIQALIDELDVEPKKGWGEIRLTIFPLLHSKASDLQKVIQDLIKSEAKGDKDAVQEMIQRLRISKADATGKLTDLAPIDLQRQLRIIPDPGTNSLIVATIEENIEPMGELIRLLDGVPLAAEFNVKLFPLRFADSETVSKALKEMFDSGKKLPEDPNGGGKGGVPTGPEGHALVYNIGLASDQRTNTLIVTGRPEQLGLVETIVGELDRPATALKFPLRLIPLEYNDATGFGKMVTELFDQRMKAVEATNAGKSAAERERIFLSVDIRTNSLIISASEENYNEIVAIAKQLDTKPAKLFDQIRIVPLARLNAKDMKTKIEDLWKRKSALRKEGKLLEDLPIIASDERSNSLVVASNREDFDEIRRLVTQLESQPVIEDIRLFKLEFADAAVLTGMLDELFKGLAGQSESFKAPTIIPDSRSNALVVAGARDATERVADVVKRLDVEAGPLTAVFKVYPLKNGSANQLAQRMQKLFDSRKEGDKTNRTPVVILSEESSNSLVCSASRDDHDVITGLIDLLDKPSSLARQFEIFPLKMAKAKTVADKLESLFKAQGEGTTGRADAIATQADERTNSIIVWAAPSQMANIDEVISKLDTSTPAVEMMVRVIQLKQALAQDFAKLLEDTLIGDKAGSDEERAVIVSFLQKDPNGKEILRKLLRQDIRIKPDPRTNSVMVMAPADSMAMLEAMIHDFDRIRPVTSEIRLFPLINSDAKTMVTQLTELFKPKEGGAEGKTESQLVFGSAMEGLDFASVGQELRFTADPRTNTLIVAGAPVYLAMVEDLVRYLDSQAAEDRVNEVYQAKFRPASDLATAVQGFIKQEIDVLGEASDEESKTRKQERQVSVESVGAADKGSSSLLVGTSRRAYQRTMEMIQSLDRPEPQVMISVLIAEVALTGSVDLGIELAGQDLTFSKNAVVGPNGIVEGSDFDFVGGTALGAGGPLGFSFTITGEDFSFLLHALQSDNRLEVLSRPVLLVRNGEEGKITVADSIPVVTSSQVSDTGSVNVTPGREDAGIILTATPSISPDGYVTIKLNQEVSNLGANIQLSQSVSQPIITKREVTTNVTVRDGETVVVGGLIQSREGNSESKVPILGDLPYLGTLFRKTQTTSSKTELLVVLTVDILRTDEDVRRMSAEQRDKYMLPDNIRQSPLMNGLRIKPQEQTLGPKEDQGAAKTPASAPPAVPPQREDREQYGPRPKTYGPPITRPTSASTTERPVYGPTIARNAESLERP